MKDIINNVKKSDTCEIQWPIAVNFVSSKDSDEEGKVHSKNNEI